MPKPKKQEAGSISKDERQKLQRLHTQSAAARGSVCNLVKASNVPVSKVGQYFHSKPFCTKFTQVTRKPQENEGACSIQNGNSVHGPGIC